jgi:small subunit ribosomal protein S1
LSAKELLREAAKKERQSKMAAVQVGLVTEGTVETIKPYGAFIDLGDGISGLLHVSQISEKRIKTPADILSVGDTVKVKVIAIKDGKLSLSVKALAENTAEKEEEEHYELPKSEAIGTSLGSLFKDLKL